ncbi:putative RNA-directed DNA polymerase from transposon X-element [Mycena sanguinolenta]|uniref:Putative RNA-directed DNA polymerase from transposon X-element n=1 Tax=Mycena sanguinolenta TaxID=230812 RepID=A0A8H6YWJ5_9AGAR|nr:putative RNA-directed DNA polymerase from transposon X-element [Mycena sanguinolenta]
MNRVPITYTDQQIRILSLNCHKSYDVLISLLNSTNPSVHDIICIQEPPPDLNKFPSLSPPHWDRILPTFNTTSPDTLLYISKTIPSSKYTQNHINSPSITSITLSLPLHTIHIFSVYNRTDTDDAITPLDANLLSLSPLPQNHSFAIFGDFNKHHALWTGPLHPERTANSDTTLLIDVMTTYGLRQCVKAGTPTYFSPVHHTTSTIDLVFITETSLGPLLEKCEALPGHGSDHALISCVFAIPLEHCAPRQRRNFRGTDWDEFPDLLDAQLHSEPLPQLPLCSPVDIDNYVDALTERMTGVLDRLVPLARASPYSRRWWNDGLSTLRRAYNTAHRAIAKDNPADPTWNVMRAAKNQYHSAIRRAKRAHWRQYITDLPRCDIWQAAKYALDPSASSSSSHLPSLSSPDGTTATTPTEKARVLHAKFFPPKPDIPPPDPDEPLPEPHPPPIFTVEDVHRAISKLSPWKAPGPSGIPNIAISAARTILAPILLNILEAGLRVGYFPKSWRTFLTVTIRKPGKSDYTLPGAHRPIAEEECLGKVVESVVTDWLSGFAERLGLLSPNQFGGRPGRCTVDALLQLVQRVKDAWRVGKVASLLLMDISQAFPSVSHDHLIRSLERKSVPASVVRLISSFLSERNTSLLFDDHVSELAPVPNGLPQGSPLSALLYLIFADELLVDGTVGYIDDNSRLEVGPSVEATTRQLRRHMRDFALPTAKRIGLRFDLPKFQLIHFVPPRRHVTHYRPLPLKIGEIVVQPQTTAKLLGVLLDYKLHFHNHVELAQRRGTKAVLALSRISSPTFGLPHAYTRQLFQTIVVPRMEYALPVWYRPVTDREGMRRGGTVWVARALGKVQRQACKLITGSLRTTATDTQNFHANIAPIHLRLNRSAYNSAARLASLPASNPIRGTFARCRRVPRFHRSPLHHLIAAFPVFRRDFETIDPLRRFAPLPPGVLSTNIAEDKDAARANMEEVVARGGFCVFTDGSGLDGGVGAAAVASRRGLLGEKRQKHLGHQSEHTVFESEVCGAILALDIIASTPRLTSADIFMDCQPAIAALAAPKSQPGQYLLAAFHAALSRLLRTRRTLKLRIHWVPAHVGIAENEAVDEYAKEAARGANTPLMTRIPVFERPLLISRAATIAVGTNDFADQWHKEWAESPRYARVSAFDSATPSKAVERMYADLSRPQCSILTQLRTGHIGLNAYLHRFKLAPSPLCQLCAVPESVPHFLLTCPTHRDARLRLMLRVKTARLSLRTLISTKAEAAPVLAFVRETGRFPNYDL